MTSVPYSISAFALAASTVTSVMAGPQDECLAPLAKEWDKSATYLAARPTIMGNISVAFSTAYGIVVVNSEMTAIHFYDGVSGPLSADQLSSIGTIEGHAPNRVKALTDAQRLLQGKLVNCLKLEK